jgi:hypothetical protein
MNCWFAMRRRLNLGVCSRTASFEKWMSKHQFRKMAACIH